MVFIALEFYAFGSIQLSGLNALVWKMLDASLSLPNLRRRDMNMKALRVHQTASPLSDDAGNNRRAALPGGEFDTRKA